MPVNWITHQGKQILYVDFRGLTKNEDLFATLSELRQQVKKASGKVLMLIDARDARISTEFMNQIKAGSNDELQDRMDRLALLGVSGLKKILVEGYARVAGSKFSDYVKLCETEEEAKNYLAGS